MIPDYGNLNAIKELITVFYSKKNMNNIIYINI